MKVLVTGSSGYLASHLADSLEDEGHKVVLFDKNPSKFKRESQEEIVGNIFSLDDINKAIKGCDCVYHFAGQADIDDSRRDPTNTIMTNITGTQNLLEASRNNSIKRFVFASTLYVYSELGSFYRVSKQACEKLVEEYQREFGLDFTILRFGSIYGPRANEFNSISGMLLQAIKEKKITRRGDGSELREYIHVKDAAKLSIAALGKEYVNQNVIITGNQKMKIQDLLIMIKEIFLNEVEIEYVEGKDLAHYEITPFAYRPRPAIKLSPSNYLDLGQGLLELVYTLGGEIYSEVDGKRISLRDKNNKK
tara:strand:- start:1064 stop:1984 length:921 start_codon:yes stop_codon:yes gene_type:complete